MWLLFGATVAAVLFARIRLLELPLERDEGEYAYTGHLLLSGIPPYKLAYSMKFPGTSVAYAVLMSIFGESINGIHLGLILINLLTAGLILFLGRELLGELGGIAVASAYCVLSLMPNVLGLAAHATHFVAMFSVAGAFLLLRALDRRSNILIAASGCLFGFALLMKQPGLFFVLFGSVYLFSRDWSAQLSAREIDRTNSGGEVDRVARQCRGNRLPQRAGLSRTNPTRVGVAVYCDRLDSLGGGHAKKQGSGNQTEKQSAFPHLPALRM